MPGIPFLVAAVLIAVAEPPQRSESRVAANVAWVRAGPEGIGTGWIIDADRGWLITCRHLVGEQSEVELFFPESNSANGSRNRADYLSRRQTLDRLGYRIHGKVIRTSDDLDLALVAMDRLPPGATGLFLAADSAKPGNQVGIIGHRYDLETLWNFTGGSVRQVAPLADGYAWQGRRIATNLPALFLDLPIEAGDSGAPVINAAGQVLGMITGTRRRASAAVAIQAAAIRGFLGDKSDPGQNPAMALLQESRNPQSKLAETLLSATVWLQPTATERRTAGVVISRRSRWILTSSAAIGESERLGVAFPLRSGTGGLASVVGERDAYADPVKLWCHGAWSAGRVLARDRRRDLALIQVESLPDDVQELSLARESGRIADSIHGVSHPMGAEFVWTYARGYIRQASRVNIMLNQTRLDGNTAPVSPQVLILQLPVQSSAAGGPIANDRRELLGILIPRTRGAMVAYAVAVEEIREFLREQSFRCWRDAVRQIREALRPEMIAAGFWMAEARSDSARREAVTRVLAMVSDHPEALLAHAEMMQKSDPEAARLALDQILLRDPWHRGALLARARMSLQRDQAKAAIADLNRWLNTTPGDCEFRRLLGTAWATAGEESKAFQEWNRTLRLDKAQRVGIAQDFQIYLQRQRQRFPDDVGRQLIVLRQGLSLLLPYHPARTELEQKVEMVTGSAREQWTHLSDILQQISSPR